MSAVTPELSAAAPSTKKIWHKSMINRNSPLGHDYEINILALSCLHSWIKTKENENSIHKTECFIGAEVKDLYPFEDIVYTEALQGTAKSIYLQAKHCDKTRNINYKQFLSEGEKSPFSLLRYFMSYQNIMKDFNPYKRIKHTTNITSASHAFVLFTNWTLDEDDVKGLEALPQNSIPFMSEVEGKLYKVKITDDPDTLYGKAKQLIKDKLKNADEDEIKDFFEHIMFAVNQPGVPQLRERIEEKLSEITGLKDADWIASTLLDKLSRWSHQKEGWYLTNRDCALFFELINQHLSNWGHASLTSMKIESLLRYGVRFKESAGIMKQLQEFLQTRPRQIAVIHYEELLLTEIKIAQAVETTRSETIFSDLTTLQNGRRNPSIDFLKAFSSKGSNHLLIIVKEHSELSIHKDLIQEFLKILTVKDNEHKKVIFIIPSKLRGTVSHIIGRDHSVFNDDQNCFLHLDDKSQEHICRTKAVVIQNHKVKLDFVINCFLKEKICGDMLSKLIKDDIAVQEVAKDKIYDEAKEFYVPQLLFRRVIIQNDIKYSFEDFDIIEEPFMDLDFTKDIILITRNNDPIDRCSIYQALCNKYYKSNIHWLVKDYHTERIYVWKKSKGSLKKLRKYVTSQVFSDDKVNDQNEISFKFDKIEANTINNIQDKTVVISANPGMGKSLFLSHIAYQTRSQRDSDGEPFIVKLNFKDHHKCTKLHDESAELSTISLVDFLFNANKSGKQGSLSKFLKVKGDQIELADACKNLDVMRLLEVTTFIYLYKQRQIVVLLDGFDEIAPIHTEKFINVLKILVDSKVKGIWMTTRPCNILGDIENILNTFTFSLEGLWESKDILIEKYLNCKVRSGPEFGYCDKRINTIKREIKQRIANTFQNFVSFLSLPMHIQMTADIYIEDAKCKLGANNIESVDDVEMILDMNILYKKYTEKKLEKLLGQDLSLLGVSGEQLLNLTIENHQKFALLELFPDNILTKEMVPEKEREELIEKAKSSSEKTGLVVPVWSSMPRFVHRTFAEYYAANFLFDQIRNGNEIQSERARNFLYGLIISDTSSVYREVFLFFNYITIAESENYNHLVAVLSGMSNGKEFCDVRNVCDIFGRTPFHWTPLHYAAVLNNKVKCELQSLQTEMSNLSAYSLQDIRGRTPLMLSLLIQNDGSDFIFETPCTISAEDSDQSTILHYFCRHPHVIGHSFAEKLLKMDGDFFKLDVKEATPFDILLETGTRDVFDHISKHKSVIIQECIKKIWISNTIVKFISKCKYILENNLVNAGTIDDEGKTALHHVVIAEDVHMAKFLLQFQDIVNHLNKEDCNEKTALHYAAKIGNFHLITLLLSYGADVHALDVYNKKPAQYIFENKQNVDNLEMFLCPTYPDSIKEFVLSVVKYTEYNNILVRAICLEQNILIYLYLKKLLKVDIADNLGRTALHYAAACAKIQIVGILMMLKFSVHQRDIHGKTPADLLFECKRSLIGINR